jgi:cellulose synthase/poly-beta-1,6-N-acetylglucosamine synthase-like glycosyltransferase
VKFYIIIPAHNEELFISLTLDSLVKQTLKPSKLLVVNDNSTDSTESIINEFAAQYDFISILNTESSDEHIPGSKIINAFNKGLRTMDAEYDVLCKFDADLIFPANYLETLAKHFKADSKNGMVGGFCYIKKNGNWVLENLTNKDHIRGALKAYRKQCFKDIDGLRNDMGWDTIDELLAQLYKWKIVTDESLQVKHLKPTGFNYKNRSGLLQGKAFYRQRLGFLLTFLASLKLAIRKREISLLFDYLTGYFDASKANEEYLVTPDQGKFIRKLRWRNIRKKVLG